MSDLRACDRIAPVCAERLIFPTLLLACLVFVPPVADAADPVTVNVTVNSSRDGTRLILTHSRPLVYVVEASRGRVRVRYADTIELRPLERRFNDPILERYVEWDWSPERIVAAGFDAMTTRDVAGMVDRNEYKRRQAAPGVKITKKAFGKDRRLPITNRFRG